MSEKLSIKMKKNTEVKNVCYYFWKINTVKQVMSLKDITTQNTEPALKNLKLMKKRLVKVENP